jgi:hypothetical protein
MMSCCRPAIAIPLYHSKRVSEQEPAEYVLRSKRVQASLSHVVPDIFLRMAQHGTFP